MLNDQDRAVLRLTLNHLVKHTRGATRDEAVAALLVLDRAEQRLRELAAGG